VPNKWWEAKVLPLKVRTPCKCKGFDCGGDWRNHFPVVVPDGYVPQWWDEQPDAVVSFYIAYESDHLVGGHDESLYMVMLMFISTVEITANDTIMLIRQVARQWFGAQLEFTQMDASQTRTTSLYTPPLAGKK
jgi:hypothetical protein